MKNSYFKSLCFLFVLTVLSACGSSGGGGNGVLTGKFIDSEVKGLRWESGDLKGVTDAAGTFQYKSGATVKFYVGDIFLGEAVGDSIIIPVNIVAGAQDITNPTVTNIIRFLLTLDNDGDPSNGIEITEASANEALGKTMNFAQSTTDFGASGAVQALVASLTSGTTSGIRTLRSASAARLHAEDSIKGLLVGSYSGTFSGDTSGTWQGTLNSSAVFSGTATSSGETLTFSGKVGTKGGGNFTEGVASDGTTYKGTFKPNGDVSGTWNFFGEETGTWKGSKTS